MGPQTTESHTKLIHFDFPFDVVMCICCLIHMMIALMGWIATDSGHVPYEDGCHEPKSWKKSGFRWKLVKASALILILLNIVFFVITFFTTIFVANTADQQRWSIPLTVYNASTLFLMVEIPVITLYVLYRVESTRRQRLKLR